MTTDRPYNQVMKNEYKFTCPKCGGHDFATGHNNEIWGLLPVPSLPEGTILGFCISTITAKRRKECCDFKWNRADDETILKKVI